MLTDEIMLRNNNFENFAKSSESDDFKKEFIQFPIFGSLPSLVARYLFREAHEANPTAQTR
jgi:hypothetical protein